LGRARPPLARRHRAEDVRHGRGWCGQRRRIPRGDPTHEAFGLGYELPNRIAYNETCANIANAMWNWRMLAVTGDARYVDVMELVLYNSMLSG